MAQNFKQERVVGSAESHWLGLGFEDRGFRCLRRRGARLPVAPSPSALQHVHGPGAPLSGTGGPEQTHRCSPDTPVYDGWKEESLLPEVVASESLGNWQHSFLFCFVLCVWFCFLNN